MASNKRGSTDSTYITPIGGNLFVDLGFSAEEAALLQVESRARISQSLSGKGSKPHVTHSSQDPNEYEPKS